MSSRDIAYKKELLILKGEMLRLRLRHELKQSGNSLGLAGMGMQALMAGGKGRLMINTLAAIIPNQRFRSIVKMTLRTVLLWQVARKYWLQR